MSIGHRINSEYCDHCKEHMTDRAYRNYGRKAYCSPKCAVLSGNKEAPKRREVKPMKNWTKK